MSTRPVELLLLCALGCAAPDVGDGAGDTDVEAAVPDTDVAEPLDTDTSAAPDTDAAPLDACAAPRAGLDPVTLRLLHDDPDLSSDAGDTGGHAAPRLERSGSAVIANLPEWAAFLDEAGLDLPAPDFAAVQVFAVWDVDPSSCQEHRFESVDAFAVDGGVAVDVVVWDSTWGCCVVCFGDSRILRIYEVQALGPVTACVAHVGGCPVDTDAGDTGC